MAIRKFTDITNETSTKYDRYKNTQIKATIENVFDTGSASNSPNDAAIQGVTLQQYQHHKQTLLLQTQLKRELLVVKQVQ